MGDTRGCTGEFTVCETGTDGVARGSSIAQVMRRMGKGERKPFLAALQVIYRLCDKPGHKCGLASSELVNVAQVWDANNRIGSQAMNRSACLT